MAVVQIKLDIAGFAAGVAGQSRDVAASAIGKLVTATIPSHPGAINVQWVLREKPQGSTAALAGASTPTATFTIDRAGDFILEVVVDGDKSYELAFEGTDFETHVSSQGGLRVRLPNGKAIPAFSETFEFGTKGWHPAMDEFLRHALAALSSMLSAEVATAFVNQLSPTRRGIGGPVRLSPGREDHSSQILIESADNHRLLGSGQYATEWRWVAPGVAGVPWVVGDQLRAFEISDLGMTAVAPLLEFLRIQDDTVDPADPDAKYAANRRSTQNAFRRLQMTGSGVAQRGLVFYLATEGGGKNDHHLVDSPTIDSYLESGIAIEGQASTAHLVVKPVLRSGLNAAPRGLYGIRCGILPQDLRVAANARVVTAVDASANSFTRVGHGFETGMGPFRWTTSGTLPAGLALATDYWPIKLTADTFAVASSLANAIAGTRVDITDVGTGTHSFGGTWGSVARKGGTQRTVGGEILDNDLADLWVDASNGCTALIGVSMEGSSREYVSEDPAPAVSLNTVLLSNDKWTSSDHLAADGEMIQHRGTGPLLVEACQHGLAEAPKELSMYLASARSFAGYCVLATEISSPYRHGHFTAMIPNSVDGSINIDASGAVTPLLYPWDGPGAKGLPGRFKPYLDKHFTAVDNPVPDQWYPCQETRQELTIASVNAGTDQLAITNHALPTGSGPYHFINSGGALPAGLVAGTDHYVIRDDATNIRVATSKQNALLGTAVDITDVGTGTHKMIRATRKTVFSAVKDKPRMDLTARAATEPADLPVLGVRRTYPGFAITSFDFTTDRATRVAHGLETGDGPYYLVNSGGALPAGLAAAAPYWIIRVDADNWQFATSKANAMGGTAVNFTNNGSGTTTIGGDYHQRWVQFTGALGQQLSWNDTEFAINPDLFDVAVDFTIDVTSAPVSDALVLVLGGVATTGLNIRMMNTGLFRVWCGGNQANGTVDMRTRGPTRCRFMYKKGGGGSCQLITPWEAPIAPTYAATVNHTSRVGFGAGTDATVSFVGFITDISLYLRQKVARLDTDLTRFGW